MEVTLAHAAFYVASGCTQPILMTLCRHAGLADPTSQLYMLFYYMGPAGVILPMLCEGSRHHEWPSSRAILKACGIAVFDILAQCMNYTGAAFSGPTIFAIVYSSVSVWAALFSRLILGRSMSWWQWSTVVLVFFGLTLTATDSVQLGDNVLSGFWLVLVGSIMHAMTYVLSEGLMTIAEEKLSIQHNCAVQASVATCSLLLWQVVYTVPRIEEKVLQPMRDAGTTMLDAVGILVLFAGVSLIHALTFLHTLKYVPGGATSAGVLKGLQAVFVFVLTHFVYCGRTGGKEMCFSRGKLLTLVTVVSGVVGYGIATQRGGRTGAHGRRHGYEQIKDTTGLEVERLPPHTEHDL